MEYSCLLASFLPIIVARTNPPTTTITPTADITAIAHTGKPLSVWKKSKVLLKDFVAVVISVLLLLYSRSLLSVVINIHSFVGAGNALQVSGIML